MRKRAPFVTAWLMALAIALPAGAQPRDVDAQAQRIFTSMMSPYCPGLLLADCPSPAAFNLRIEIRERLEAGESAADVERDLYRKFGDVIRAVPEPGGWGTVLWIAPALVLTVSLAALMWFLGRVRTVETAPVSSQLSTDPALEERLQQELDDVP
jgi:cytochrome c-type biogenesis protein CcmH